MAAKTMVVLKTPSDRMISGPMPSWAPTHSATRAPTTARTHAFFKPANMNGTAAGRRTLNSVCQRPASREYIRSRYSDSSDRIPAWVLMSIGKKQSSAATRIFGRRVNPNHRISKGAMASVGMAWDTTA